MFLSLRNKPINSITQFMREVIIWLLFVVVIEGILTFTTIKLGFKLDPLIASVIGAKALTFIKLGLFVVQGLLIFFTVQMLKRTHYWAAVALLFVALLLSAVSGFFTGLGNFDYLAKQKVSFSVWMIFVFSIFLLMMLIKAALIAYGYRTKKDLSHWGSKRAFIVLIIAWSILITIMELTALVIAPLAHIRELYGREAEITKLTIGAYTAVGSLLFFGAICIYGVIFIRLLAFDAQKIKNIDINVIKNDSQVARSAVLLYLLMLYLDFYASIFRVLLPWDNKK